MIPTEKEWKQVLESRHGRELQYKFSEATVAICGLGGLGSNVAIMLARAGVGRLILIDFDIVDVSNLHRQQYKASQTGMFKTEATAENLKEINPYITTEIHTACINNDNVTEILDNADIICEAFDNAESKAILADTVLTGMPDKYFVAASGMAGLGSSNDIRTRKITKRFYLCGDEISDIDGEIGIISSRVTLCAAHQAHMILRILAEKFEP